MAVSIDELPLPEISSSLSKEIRTEALLIFYKHLVRVSAWGLRGMHGLYVEQEGRTEKDDQHDLEVWNDPLFQIRYQTLLRVCGALPFFRWPAYLQEFVFYNSVGVRHVPFEVHTPDPNAGFEINEGQDNLGKFVQVRVYAQLSTESWRRMRSVVDKKLKSYERKWEHKGTNLELIVQTANLHRIKPELTHDQIAGQIMTKFPELATKANGYQRNDIKHILRMAEELEF